MIARLLPYAKATATLPEGIGEVLDPGETHRAG
jgi:hypothetical protein